MSKSEHEDLKKRELLAVLKRQRQAKMSLAIDPYDLESRASPQQQQIFEEQGAVPHQFCAGGNQSGKTSAGGRMVAWFFERNHPYLDIEELWPGDPMLIIVCAKIGNQLADIWDKKIEPFLTPGTYRVYRQGTMLAYCTHMETKSKIVFMTHHNPNEAQQKAQMYSAHFVWIDELTPSVNLVEELQRRVQAKRGRFLMTYTPKIRAPAVKKFIETPTTSSKIYKLHMFSNPIYKGREDEINSQLAGLSDDRRAAVLAGDWAYGDHQVFYFDPEEHMANVEYNNTWAYIVAVDPASAGLAGYTLWTAKHSNALMWYLIDAAYIRGTAPSDLVDEIEGRIAHLPIVKRIADPHEVWFIKEAYKRHQVTYVGPWSKNNRKKELVAQLNEALGTRIMVHPNCREAVEELSSAQYSETDPDKIQNSKILHIADSMQYFVDCMPQHKDVVDKPVTHDAALKLANKKRLAKEAQTKKTDGPRWSVRLRMRKRAWKASRRRYA